MSRVNRGILPQAAPLAACIAVTLLVLGCVAPQTHLRKDSSLDRIPRKARVLLMEPDIQIFEVTAGGMHELKADWTEAARAHVRAALAEHLKACDDALLPYLRPADPGEARADEQILKLHDVVGGTILVHGRNPALKLPTKEGELDYTLGTGTGRLKQRFGADYALFLFVRDSHISPGRAAVIVSAALLGVVVPGGIQQGFASLVDLSTGDILWCNQLLRDHGDLRQPGAAAESVAVLLKGLPL